MAPANISAASHLVGQRNAYKANAAVSRAIAQLGADVF